MELMMQGIIIYLIVMTALFYLILKGKDEE
jgi:hypothetical protein